MAILKRKTASGYDVIADEFPVKIPVQITQVAANLQRKTITESGEYFPETPYNGFSSVLVDIAGGLPNEIKAGDTPIMVSFVTYTSKSSTLQDTGMQLTIPRDGTYRFKWVTAHNRSSSNVNSRLYVNGSAVGSQVSGRDAMSQDLTVSAGDVVTLYAGGGSSTYYATASCLSACINWDIGI